MNDVETGPSAEVNADALGARQTYRCPEGLLTAETIEEQFLGEWEEDLPGGFLVEGMFIVALAGCFVGKGEDETDVIAGVGIWSA